MVKNLPLECKDISFSYGAREILKDISIQFNSGHLYGIIGPNGSGKTTLLKILVGILKPDYGDVLTDNINLKKMKPREVAKEIAVVNQTSSIDFNYTVKEIVMMGRYSHVGRFSKETSKDKRIVEVIFDKFDLSSLKDRPFNELSGGEQQKVIIARAIAQQSKIILLDEPTTHLDINYQIEFMEMLKEYVNDGLIVVVVLHDLNLASKFCDKIILVNNGEIKALGDRDVILTPENLRNVYNVEVLVRRNLFSESVHLTPLKSIDRSKKNQSDEIKRKSLHVIVGGGAALNILPKLKNHLVSVGVVNETDDDYELAKHFGYKIISEAPFCAISENSALELQDRLNSVDIIILTNIPFGKGNVKNLELLSKSDKYIINYEKRKIEERDFTGGVATEIYKKLILKSNVRTVDNISELLELIDNYEVKC